MQEGPLWVAVREGAILGTVAAISRGGDLYIRGMAVLPSARGQAIGELLLEHIGKYALAHGHKRLTLSTTPFLDRAIRLYESCGFRRVEEGPHELFGTPLFAMEKVLHRAGAMTNIEYSFRPATAADVSAVAALVNSAYGHYIERIGRLPRPMTEDYAVIIGNGRTTVAEYRGTIAGVLVLAVNDEGFLIENVAVDPSHRGHGLGKGLLHFAEAEARQAGFDSIHLYTHEKMTENLALYSRIGYVEYDRRSEGKFSLVYMRKHLG